MTEIIKKSLGTLESNVVSFVNCIIFSFLQQSAEKIHIFYIHLAILNYLLVNNIGSLGHKVVAKNEKGKK